MIDTLPARPDGAAVLSKQQCQEYDRNGFLIVRSLFSADDLRPAALEAETLLGRHDLISTQNLRCRWQTNVGTGECLFETFDPITDLSPACRNLAHDPRLKEMLACLYGEEAHL